MNTTTSMSSPSRCVKNTPVGQQRCRLILQHCLAIQLCKPGHTPEDFWMYDSGYMIFQNFLAANAQCWWNTPLTAATRALKYAGHVAPGMLLVTAEPCALEVIRGAYARSVLKPPATYIINYVGDIDDCVVTPTAQGQFTPLTEALCDAIMDLTSQGHTATMENIKVKLTTRFTHMQQPTGDMIYDTLAQLMQERKIYQTARGYFIVTPERRRSRSRPRGNNRSVDNSYEDDLEQQGSRTMLLTNAEAINNLYGEITTERDGDLTHQCIQTNLADVICGGNPNDKIIYPRSSKRRSASFPTPRSLERRHSLRLFGSSKRLQRCSSTRSLTKNYAQTLTPDSSSSEYQSNESPSPKHNSQIEKGSLLSRLFRRSGRTKQRQIETYSAQFPPLEWFNSRTVHLHSIGTQTTDPEMPVQHILSNSTFYDGSEFSQRSSTLPRRHRRHMSSESTFVISSRDCSPIRRRSPGYYSGSLPRSTHSIPSSTTIQKTQRTLPNKQIIEEKNSLSSKSSEIFAKQETYVDNKLLCDKDRHYRNMQSGPSSLESGKASLLTSGPSSIDSGKAYLSKTSGHSSLDSQTSTNSIATIQSPARSINKQSPKRNHYLHNQQQQQQHQQQQQYQHPYNQQQTTTINKTKLTNDTVNRMKSASTQQHHQQQTQQQQNTSPSISFSDYKDKSIPNSKSNNSITLQVTTTNNYQNNIPSTKIFVENSPIKSVITLENGKLLENSNVYIINNETTTTSNGELINKKISTSHHTTPNRISLSKPMENDCSIEEHNVTGDNDEIINVEVNCDDNKLIIRNEELLTYENKQQDQQPDDKVPVINDDAIKLKQIINKHVNQGTNIDNSLQMVKNNINYDNNCVTMNNNRINNIQQQQQQKTTTASSNNNNNNNNNNIIYKNLLKLNDSNKEICDNNIMCGSVGNLRTLNDKNLIKNKTIKSINDLKQFNEHQHQLEHHQQITDNLLKNKNFHLLNSNPNIKDNEIESLLQKNIITVGSEPNLTIGKNYECNKYKIIEKELVDRRFSLTKNTIQQQQQQTLINDNNSSDLYNFPSLTDLSFNFTSITAQKLLQGVSRNSIDTLVELNMAKDIQDKQQNNVTNVCQTDYGMV